MHLPSSERVFAIRFERCGASSWHDLPILLAGNAGGSLPQGRLIASPTDTPLCALWLPMLQRFGLEAEEFGDARRPLV